MSSDLNMHFPSRIPISKRNPKKRSTTPSTTTTTSTSIKMVNKKSNSTPKLKRESKVTVKT